MRTVALRPVKLKLPRPTWRILSGVAPGLSLRQPWAWAVVSANKTVENRLAWKRGCPYHGWILVHAAEGMTVEEYDQAVSFMTERRLARQSALDSVALLPIIPTRDQLARGGRGGVIGVARIVGVVDRGQAIRRVTGLPPFLDALSPEERRWWMGGFAMLLSDAVALPETIPCAGALGFFTPPASVYAAVERMLSSLGSVGEPEVVLRRERWLRPREDTAGSVGPIPYYACGGERPWTRCACETSQRIASGSVDHPERCSCSPDKQTRLRARCGVCGADMRALDPASGWSLDLVE